MNRTMTHYFAIVSIIAAVYLTAKTTHGGDASWVYSELVEMHVHNVRGECVTEFECRAPDGSLLHIRQYPPEFLDAYRKLALPDRTGIELRLSNPLTPDQGMEVIITDHIRWSLALASGASGLLSSNGSVAAKNVPTADGLAVDQEGVTFQLLAVYVSAVVVDAQGLTQDLTISVSENDVKNSLFGECNDTQTALACQYANCSNGKINIIPTVGVIDGHGVMVDDGLAKVTVEFDAETRLSSALLRNEALRILGENNNVGSLVQLSEIDKIMVIVPKLAVPQQIGTATSTVSTIQNHWVTDTTVIMHEFGHKLGFGHSFQIDQNGVQIWDKHGYMGPTGFAPNANFKKCFDLANVSSLNDPNLSHLGWYDELVIEQLSEPRSVDIVGIVDADNELDNNPTYASIAVLGETRRVHIGYNKATGFNKDTEHGEDSVVVVEKIPGRSIILSYLKQGEAYNIEDFWGAGNGLHIQAEIVPTGIPNTLQFARILLESNPETNILPPAAPRFLRIE